MKKRLLVITPDFSLNGANVVLLELLECLNEKYTITIIASEDGTLYEKFSTKGYKCKLCQSVSKSNIDECDEVFLNASSVHYYALLFQNTDKKVYWWFHESMAQLNTQRTNFVHLGLLSDNFHFLAAAPMIVRGLKEMYGVQASLLPMVIKDVSADFNCSEEKIIFMPGAYTYIKGQDVLLSAISRLPLNMINEYQFVFAGYHLEEQSDYYNKLEKIASRIPNVKLLSNLSREEVYEYYKKAICVVAPSRVDTSPATIVEALMFSKLCIVSSGAGISEFMTDCINGFVFQNEDVDELYKRLLLVMTEYSNLDQVKSAGRKVYEENFSIRSMKDRYLSIFD